MCRPQFSLKTLLWLMFVVAICSFAAHRIREHALEEDRPVTHKKWLENKRQLDKLADRAQAAYARAHPPSRETINDRP